MINFNGVSTERLSSLRKPSGFTDPSVTKVEGNNLWIWDNVISVDRATVYNSDRVATLENILDDITVGLNKVCEDIASQLENTTNDVEAYAELLDMNTNIDPDDSTSDYYLNKDDAYLCRVIIYAKVTEN